MISKGCIDHIVWVRDTNSNTLTLQSIPIANEFFDVFLCDLPDILPKRKIDIALLLGTQSIYISPYHMTLAKHKELKE